MYCLKKKCFASQKIFFCFSHDFQTWFHDTDHLLYYSHILYSLYIFFKQDKNTNPSLLIQVVKVQQNEWKKKPRGIRVWTLNI